MNMFKKTKAQTRSAYLASLAEPRKADIKTLDVLIRKTVPKLKPFFLLNMLAYGPFHYKSKRSSAEGDWAVIGLANQKNYISLYVCVSDGKQYLAEKFKKELPKASIGRSCIRFKKLEDIDLKVVQKILKEAGKMASKGQILM